MSDEKKTIKIDKDSCIGCGGCEAIAPDYFEVASDGKAIVKKEYNAEEADLIQEAADGCPVGAITIE